MNDKMKNLAVRAASGAALVAVMFGATLWNRGGFAAMLAVVGAGCLGEFYAMARRAGLRPMRGRASRPRPASSARRAACSTT